MAKLPLNGRENSINKFLDKSFEINQLDVGIDYDKINKAAGLDELRSEQIKHFSLEIKLRLLNMMNTCITSLTTCQKPGGK